MPTPTSPSEQEPGQLASERYRQATKIMQEAAKWQLTGAAGLGGALLAGLQFSDLGRLAIPSPAFSVALVGGCLALTGVGLVLWRAGKLLTTHIDTYRDVLTIGEQVERKKGVRAVMVSDLIKAVEGEADFLYQGVATDRKELFARYRASTDSLYQAQSAKISTANNVELALRADLDELNAAMTRVVDYADYWLTRRDFSRMLWWLAAGGILVAAGLGLFAVATTENESPLTVSRPIAVRIHLTTLGTERVRGLLGCDITAVDAVAVDGNLGEPEVVIPASGQCRAGRLRVTDEIGVAIPEIT